MTRYCCECDFCAAGPCEGGVYCLFLTDDSGYGHTLVCCAHAAIVGKRTRAYLAAHPGVAVDPECADAWAVIEAETELAARRAAVARMAAVCPVCGRSLKGHGGTYAQGDASDVWGPLPPFDGTQERVFEPAAGATDWPPPSGWRDRPGML
jgi:hypothetical protein